MNIDRTRSDRGRRPLTRESVMGVIVATHQPIFLPWPGFFHKATHADCLVLLDDVQFPRGRSWLTRNRLKNEEGELYLRVPVLRKGRGLQTIRRVEIESDKPWRKKHLVSIRQNYIHAPYFADYFPGIEAIYQKNHALLAELTTQLISFLLNALSLNTTVMRQSELGATGTGTGLLIEICKRLGAGRFLTLPGAEKHFDGEAMRAHGIETVRARFHPPIYPQLWGDFIYNLSTLDLLLNCGPKSAEIIAGPGGPSAGGSDDA
jgi:hypothetical protein